MQDLEKGKQKEWIVMGNRKRIIFRVISILLTVSIIISRPIDYSISAKSITGSEVQAKLNTLLGQFPANTTWDRNFAGGSQCYAFAHYIFNTIFDRGSTQVGNGALSSNPTCYKLNNVASDINTIGTLAPGYSLEQLEALLEKAMPGDYLQVKRRSLGGPHSMIVTCVDAANNRIGIFDANAVARNKVGQYSQTFSDFMQRNAGVTLYRYNGYERIDVCNCNESYKGNYTVTTDGEHLNLRSGHGMAYSIITTIPKGERVYVSKGNGSWVHVEWNGYSGYSDMRYLTKIETSAKSVKLHAWISDAEMGNVPENYKLGKTYYLCYEVLDSSTGKRLDDGKYSINETLYSQNGSVISTRKYENRNNNCMGYCAYTPGIYRGVVTISGDYDLKVEVSYEVKPNKVEEIQIQDSNGNYRSNLLMKNIGDTVILKAKIAPEDAEDKTVTWTSNDSTVVSVDSNGKITAKKDGVAKITVTAKDGGVSAYCNVKVKTYGIVYGDCNDDGAVTATDLSVINQAVNGTLKLSEEEKKVFDLSGDGVVDDEDVELLKQFVLGTRTSFPVEEQLSEIVISTMPDKTTYYIGDSISIQGVTVKAYYNNGTSKIVNDLDIDGEASTAGKQTVTLFYTEAGITKSVLYSIYVKQKESVEATMLPIEKPIKTNIPTAVPVKTLKPTATVETTVIPSPAETEDAATIGTLEPIATSDVSDFVTMQPTDIPVLTAAPIIKSTVAPKATEDTTNGQNDKKDDVEEYDVYEIENEDKTLQEGDVFEIKSAIYEVTDESDTPMVELVTIEKKNLKSVSVPATVKYKGVTYKVTGIAKSAFKNNKKITSLTVGSNVTYIGSYAFYKNSKLKKITIKSLKLENVQKKAFWGLSKKITVKLPASKKENYKKLLKNAGLGKR